MFYLGSRNTRSSLIQNLYFRMACLLQPECNFLHGYFRCWLPEVVDVEEKITSMQGTHIFRRDRTMQLIKCTTWSTRLCPHPTIIKKMKTFLEVEGKMGAIPQPTSNQYRSPQLDTNPKVRKDNVVEKRKRAAPIKRFKPSTTPKPSETTTQPPVTVSKVPETPKNRPPPLEKVQVHESTPWPGTGRMSGNLFEDRNWLLPPNYLNNDCKDAVSQNPSLRKSLRQKNKGNVDGDQIVPFAKTRRRRTGMASTKPNSRKFTPARNTKTPSKTSSNAKLSEAPGHTKTCPRDTPW